MLYPIERYLALHELIEIYASYAASGFGVNMSAGRMQREGVNLLLQAQSTAYQNNQLDDATTIAEALVGVYFGDGDFEGARPFAEQYLQLIRERESPSVLARALGMVSIIDYQSGNAETAQTVAEQALVLLSKADQQRSLGGFLLCHLATTTCYLGKYTQAAEYFQKAEAWFNNRGNELGTAWHRHSQAREYMRDQNHYQLAVDALITALPMLEERTAPQAVIENLLATVDCWCHIGTLDHVPDVMMRLDALITQHNRRWYSSEYLMMKGKVAFVTHDDKTAVRYLHEGIGTVSLGGDIRLLSPLYRLLGMALSSDPDTRDGAIDAFDRSIACARSNARKADLAWALHETGQYLKRVATRPTEQARSSGYLYEARKLFTEMGLTPPAL